MVRKKHPQSAYGFTRANLCTVCTIIVCVSPWLRADESVHTSADKQAQYDRDIRPILSDRCFKCHGPDESSREADLRLDLPDVAFADRGGYAAIVPAKPDDSEILRRVRSEDPDEVMPPPGSNKHALSSEQQDLIRQWISDGAHYEPHWSFVAPVRPALPRVTHADTSRNEVDLFIRSKLEQEQIDPSPAADPATVIRRLFLDLTGLPPTPQELAEFLTNPTYAAYRRWVDRLLGEEPYRSRYAEHMATAWMDAARYADTIGIHTDAGRQMWLWRDWVLRAYRDNMPFDQFLVQQLAGDLLPDATLDQKVASGFNRNHVITDEGGAINEEYLVEYAVDRTATTSAVFLALTMGCARCHDHKFDPISQADFYSMYAFFNSNDEPGLYSQLPNPVRAFEPFLKIPTEEQTAQLGELNQEIASARRELDRVDPTESIEREAYFAHYSEKHGLNWKSTAVLGAESLGGATLDLQTDGSILVSGENPARDTYTVRLRTDAEHLSLIALEALPDPNRPDGRVGRASNGNAVVSSVRAKVISVADPTQEKEVQFAWTWADYSQTNGDFDVLNLLASDRAPGWALGGHEQEGARIALLLCDGSFGFEGGTDVVMELHFDSQYPRHSLGRFRVHVGSVDEQARDVLPLAASTWYSVGPFETGINISAYESAYGPEKSSRINLADEFDEAKLKWQYRPEYQDGQTVALADGQNVTYVGRRIFAPTPRTIKVSLGSDDGFELFVNGKSVTTRQIDRAVAADQDSAEIRLAAGYNSLVLKIINTGGNAGFYYQVDSKHDGVAGDLVSAWLPTDVLRDDLRDRRNIAWRTQFSHGYNERKTRLDELLAKRTQLEDKTPLTMIMQELPEPRPTFVLKRGSYDAPDKTRPVQRAVPAALGGLLKDAPRNRLGLAYWMTSADNPLVARVAVNRIWERFFGTGLVRTSEDFGYQGEWPSHPELLDWLAVELRESQWDQQQIIRLIVTSQTYRQASRVRTDIVERDPDNRMLAWFPRRRLSAEQLRDQALYVAGLLHERFGGPSVKPYQPDGLWQEVAMTQSNTRNYEQGTGIDLWRRSLYTYWKRACPPPTLLTLDAPTREFCTIRRGVTNTPLQALALWNDPQFVEAARVLAQRTLAEKGSDKQRLSTLFIRCAGRKPDDWEAERLADSLATFRQQFSQSNESTAEYLAVGEAVRQSDASDQDLAAWTMMANAVLNLAETVTQD